MVPGTLGELRKRIDATGKIVCANVLNADWLVKIRVILNTAAIRPTPLPNEPSAWGQASPLRSRVGVVGIGVWKSALAAAP